jgi:hypothetical protein
MTSSPSKQGFTSESFWIKLEGFQEAVEAGWSSVAHSPCPFETLSRKFKATVKALPSWSQRAVGHVNSQLELAREILHQLEITQDARGLVGRELCLRNKLKPHSLALASLQRTIARSRSRISWLSENDTNIALFHQHARHRKGKNFISKLTTEEGVVITDHVQKEKNIFEFYSKLLGVNVDQEFTVNLEELTTPRLNLESLMHLSLRKRFGKLSTLSLRIKLPAPMVLQASFTRCAGR